MNNKEVSNKYVIFQIGKHQYQGIEGQTVAIEKIAGEIGDTLEFAEVLLKKSDTNIEIGQPFLATPIKATIVKQIKDKKVIDFTFKRRKKVRVKKGHRQEKTIIRIAELA